VRSKNSYARYISIFTWGPNEVVIIPGLFKANSLLQKNLNIKLNQNYHDLFEYIYSVSFDFEALP